MSTLRRRLLTGLIMARARGAVPRLSATEREALEAGDTWWDAALFSGSPDWQQLLDVPAPRLSDDEVAFLEGPVESLCAELDDWQITWELRDLPPNIWRFLKEYKFFGMNIPKRYGGLGFSAYAQSEVIRKISSRSIAAAVTVMVPNSLGPGELLLQFGTEAQQRYWLPRLAMGDEVPCFGLTSPEAGSDAASITDRGIVCRRHSDGEESIGIRLTWNKRYITLGPVATLLGLAFKLYDPDHLIGETEDLGITVALVPTDAEGVEIGRRHLPCLQGFQNGPTRGRDVFIRLDQVIGGEAQVGGGWRMLTSALAAGRGVSLPSLSAAGAAFAARTTGAYARIREQFGLPIGKFEGVQERLGRLAATTYLLDAGRRLTCAGLDEGHKSAVISAIMKVQATQRMRHVIDDAMDVHAGKTVIDGPLNYLGNIYRAVPVGITVEGANILTRSLIVFGQGAIRCHPWLLREMTALSDNDRNRSLRDFDRAFWAHVAHSTRTLGRAWVRSWTAGRIGPTAGSANSRRYFKQLSRYSATFALIAECALLTLGGTLKRREMLSARLGDILSELYLLSAVLKRWHDEGQQVEDLPLVQHCLETGFATIEACTSEVLSNLPNRPAAWFVKLIVQPLGHRRRGPSDALTRTCAEILLEPSESRDRLTAGLFQGAEGDSVRQLETAHRLVVDSEPVRRKLRKADIQNWQDDRASALLTDEEIAQAQAAQDAVSKVIQVDDFPPESLTETANPGLPRRQRTVNSNGRSRLDDLHHLRA